MNRPREIEKFPEIDLKLGIKSSLPNVKGTLALLILIWISMDKPSEILYSKEEGNELKLADNVNDAIKKYLSPYIEKHEINEEQLEKCICNNQLLRSQIEALLVAFELVWKLAKIRFEDSSKPFSAERTGGIRYNKVLTYTINMDIIGALFDCNREKLNMVILNWLGCDVEVDSEIVKSFCKVLTAMSENSVYKLDDNGKGVIFNQNELYKGLEETESMDINGDKEAKGSLRILKSLLSDGLNPYLSYKSGSVTFDDNLTRLSAYQKRVDAYLSLSSEKIIKDDIEVKDEKTDMEESYKELIYNTKIETKYERNRIVFGAPGTGKSYELKEDCEDLLKDTNGSYERVTFHPDYSYSQFVGTYKPVMGEDEKIRYAFVPGPFMRVYVDALKSGRTENPQPHLLLIEEINRAKVAAVFGDVFQLLDRDDDGVSEYEIQASEDVRKYLTSQLKGDPENYQKIRVPNNMFIWSTMNSADQGVFPMDTAFKRRWNFEYLGINENEEEISGIGKIDLAGSDEPVEWNILRRAINAKMSSDQFKINEDKLMGPFFLSKKVIASDENGMIINTEKFVDAFKSKVIMYLYEDAVKQGKHRFFEGCDNSKYSSVCDAFDEIGMGIFGSNFKDNFYDKQRNEA